jgi:hypothetical protein
LSEELIGAFQSERSWVGRCAEKECVVVSQQCEIETENETCEQYRRLGTNERRTKEVVQR